jgi:elongation of very long chain fatty acids protein 4
LYKISKIKKLKVSAPCKRFFIENFNSIFLFAGMMELFLGVINSLVHVFMYTYYLLSSVSFTKRLMISVKPFVTILQLTQFLIITGHCIAAVMPSCDATRLFYIQFPNVFLLIYMFVNFFIKTYWRDGEKKKKCK